MNQEQTDRRRILHGVMLAVLAWGSVLAFGAYLYGVGPEGGVRLTPSVTRGAIVLSCVVTFVGSWFLLVRQQRTP
jgi:hypothetical protein